MIVWFNSFATRWWQNTVFVKSSMFIESIIKPTEIMLLSFPWLDYLVVVTLLLCHVINQFLSSTLRLKIIKPWRHPSFSVFRKHILYLTSPASDVNSFLRSDLPSCFGGMLTSSSYKHELGQLQEFVQPLWSLRRLNNSNTRHRFRVQTATMSAACCSFTPAPLAPGYSLHTSPHLRWV